MITYLMGITTVTAAAAAVAIAVAGDGHLALSGLQEAQLGQDPLQKLEATCPSCSSCSSSLQHGQAT